MSKLDVLSGGSGSPLVASTKAKLGALMEITQSLGKVLALDEVLPQMLDSLFRIFVQAGRGFIDNAQLHSCLLIMCRKS